MCGKERQTNPSSPKHKVLLLCMLGDCFYCSARRSGVGGWFSSHILPYQLSWWKFFLDFDFVADTRAVFRSDEGAHEICVDKKEDKGMCFFYVCFCGLWCLSEI